MKEDAAAAQQLRPRQTGGKPVRLENEEILMAMDPGYAAEGTGPLPNHNSRKPLTETVTYL